ncbi:MAG: calcium/proton exchanger [Chloroflexota bacterium]|nr:MAG: calcium/proton exchanger [Bellilinea sp.]
MKILISYLQRHPIHLLLLAIPVSILSKLFHWQPLWIFGLSAIAVIPLASLIGESTEALAAYTGPKIGGLLNATLGNAAELIITILAIRQGLLELVKASITGSIIGNLLLVMGLSMLLGGLKNGIQRFDRQQSSNHAVMLVVVIVALLIPSFFSHSIGAESSWGVELLSLGVAGVMIALYVVGLIYTLKVSKSPITVAAVDMEEVSQNWKPLHALTILAVSTFGVVIMSEFLVGSVEEVVLSIGVSEFFLGIILIPLIGNIAEHLVSVTVAVRNNMDLSMEIAVSSSLQIALFVAPLLVFISLLMGNPLTLIFNRFELLALGGGVVIAAMVAFDGESNWLEGAALLGIYLILGIGFFLLPTGG